MGEGGARRGRKTFPWGNSNPVSGQVNLCDGKCADAGNQTSFQDNYIDVAPVGSPGKCQSIWRLGYVRECLGMGLRLDAAWVFEF